MCEPPICCLPTFNFAGHPKSVLLQSKRKLILQYESFVPLFAKRVLNLSSHWLHLLSTRQISHPQAIQSVFFYAEIAIWTPIWQSWSAPSTSKVDPRALGMVIFRTRDGEHDSDAEFGAKIAILGPTLWARGLPDTKTRKNVVGKASRFCLPYFFIIQVLFLRVFLIFS